jgi:hypothetical protein
MKHTKVAKAYGYRKSIVETKPPKNGPSILPTPIMASKIPALNPTVLSAPPRTVESPEK